MKKSRCTVEMVANANSNTGYTDYWHTIQTTNVEEFSVTGSNFLAVVFVAVTIFLLNFE